MLFSLEFALILPKYSLTALEQAETRKLVQYPGASSITRFERSTLLKPKNLN